MNYKEVAEMIGVYPTPIVQLANGVGFTREMVENVIGSANLRVQHSNLVKAN
jgi:hypothetical protein